MTIKVGINGLAVSVASVFRAASNVQTSKLLDNDRIDVDYMALHAEI